MRSVPWCGSEALSSPKSVILKAVFLYIRCGVSYRELEENLAERGVHVDHATLNLCVTKNV